MLLTVSDQTSRYVFLSSGVECLTRINEQLSRACHAGQWHHWGITGAPAGEQVIPLPLIVSRFRRLRVAMYPLTSGGSIEVVIVSLDGLADADFDGYSNGCTAYGRHTPGCVVNKCALLEVGLTA